MRAPELGLGGEPSPVVAHVNRLLGRTWNFCSTYAKKRSCPEMAHLWASRGEVAEWGGGRGYGRGGLPATGSISLDLGDQLGIRGRRAGQNFRNRGTFAERAPLPQC